MIFDLSNFLRTTKNQLGVNPSSQALLKIVNELESGIAQLSILNNAQDISWEEKQSLSYAKKMGIDFAQSSAVRVQQALNYKHHGDKSIVESLVAMNTKESNHVIVDLIDKFQPINEQTSRDIYCLALKNKNYELICLLLEKRVPPAIEGKSALPKIYHVCVKTNNLKLLKLLLEGRDLTKEDKNIMTLVFHKSIDEGANNLFTYFLSKYKEFTQEAIDNLDIQMICRAAHHKNVGIFESILKVGQAPLRINLDTDVFTNFQFAMSSYIDKKINAHAQAQNMLYEDFEDFFSHFDIENPFGLVVLSHLLKSIIAYKVADSEEVSEHYRGAYLEHYARFFAIVGEFLEKNDFSQNSQIVVNTKKSPQSTFLQSFFSKKTQHHAFLQQLIAKPMLKLSSSIDAQHRAQTEAQYNSKGQANSWVSDNMQQKAKKFYIAGVVDKPLVAIGDYDYLQQQESRDGELSSIKTIVQKKELEQKLSFSPKDSSIKSIFKI